MAVENLLNDEAVRKKRNRLIVSIIIGVVLFHALAGIGAAIFVVARYFAPPPATFEVKKDIRLPAKEREHKMNMAEFDAMTPKPSFNDKLQSLRPTPFALPELPKVPMDQMLPLDPSAIVSDTVSSLVGATGLGSGGEGGAGMGGTGTGMSFFGIESNARRVLLLFDVSTSVVNKANKAGVPLSKIKEETLNLINSLPPNARFGMIQFTQNYKPFRTELLPATDQNKQAAAQWVSDEWVESGTMAASGKVVSNPRGFLGVLELAAKMQPEVIFVISDASFQWKGGKDGKIGNIPWRDLRAVAEGPLQANGACALNFVTFEVRPDDRKEASSLARRTGGKLREMK